MSVDGMVSDSNPSKEAYLLKELVNLDLLNQFEYQIRVLSKRKPNETQNTGKLK